MHILCLYQTIKFYLSIKKLNIMICYKPYIEHCTLQITKMQANSVRSTEIKLSNLGIREDIKNPAILLIGGRQADFSKSEFETKPEKFSNFKIFKINIDDYILSDIVANFDDNKDRISIAGNIKSMGYDIVLIQFDYNVIKFMKGLSSLFQDVYNILTLGGMFIFPYETISVQSPEKSGQFITQSLQMIKGELEKNFKSGVTVYENEPYPFFQNKCIYYVCTKYYKK